MRLKRGHAHVESCHYMACLLHAIGHIVDSFSPSKFHYRVYDIDAFLWLHLNSLSNLHVLFSLIELNST
jgi:hypothetical protein